MTAKTLGPENENEKKEPETRITEDLSDHTYTYNQANPFNWSKKRKWRVVAIISCMMLLNVIATMACTPAVPQILSDFQTPSPSYSILLVSIWELGECFGPFFIGPLADHFGRLPIWHICNILYAICALVCGFSTNVSTLLAFRFLNGFVAAPLTLGPTIVSDMFLPEQRGAALGIVNVMPMTGLSLGPIIGTAVIGQGQSWRWIFWIISIAVGGFELSSMMALPETHSAIILRRHSKEESSLPSGPRFSLITLLRAFKIWLFYPVALVLVIYYAFLWGIEYLIFTTLTEVLESQYHISAKGVGLCFMGWGFGYATGLLVGGIGSDWYIKKKKASRGSIKTQDRIPPAAIGGTLTVVGLFFYGWTAEMKVHWIAPIIATAIQTFGVAIVSISSKAYLIDSFPDYAASATGAGTILMSLSGALIPLAGPPLYARLGLGWGNSVLGFIALAMTPLPMVFVRLGEQGRSQQIFCRGL